MLNCSTAQLHPIVDMCPLQVQELGRSVLLLYCEITNIPLCLINYICQYICTLCLHICTPPTSTFIISFNQIYPVYASRSDDHHQSITTTTIISTARLLDHQCSTSRPPLLDHHPLLNHQRITISGKSPPISHYLRNLLEPITTINHHHPNSLL